MCLLGTTVSEPNEVLRTMRVDVSHHANLSAALTGVVLIDANRIDPEDSLLVLTSKAM